MPGRHQLVKSTLTFTATQLNTVLLIFATAHKKTITKPGNIAAASIPKVID